VVVDGACSEKGEKEMATLDRTNEAALQPADDAWVVVLAGGDGLRVRDLIRRRLGVDRPKQYCSFGGARTLLRQTIDRAEGLVSRERIVIVAAEAHRRWWDSDLAFLHPANVVAQPSNRGTAVGVMAGLFRVLERNGGPARLLFLPSDQRVRDEQRLHAALVRALDETGAGRLVLLGMETDRPEAGYGWIAPGSRDRAAHDVRGFVEKPRIEAAGRLVAEGALVNSFIFAVTSGALLRLYRQTAYDVLFSFLTHKRGLGGPGAPSLASLYDRLEPRDFSRDILEQVVGDLAVVRVRECGWEDLGTPERLERHLSRLSPFPRAPRPMMHPGL